MSSSPSQDPTMLADRYVLGEMLGRGGMASVHRGIDQLLGREVAIKVLRNVDPTDQENARFLAEAKTLAALNHPGLVTILDIYSDDDLFVPSHGTRGWLFIV